MQEQDTGLLVYQASLDEAQADARLAALLAPPHTAAPFDRLDWLALLAAECLPDSRCFLSVAGDGDAMAALALRESAPREAASLANWYSFYARPAVSDPAKASALLNAIVRDLARGHDRLHLAPLPEADARLLAEALRAAGWIVFPGVCDSNHFVDVSGRSFAEFWASRPGRLRETVRRKSRKGVVALRISTSFNAADWAAYEAVYGLSWKPGEGSPAFLRRWAEMEGAAGRLRLGIADIGGKPVAAQFWTVEGGTAFIHKLAHDESAKAHSPGSLLSAALFEHVIDTDRVAEVDFGTGDDPYKRDWMDAVRQRWALEAYRPGAARLWPALAKAAVRQMVKPRPLVSARDAG